MKRVWVRTAARAVTSGRSKKTYSDTSRRNGFRPGGETILSSTWCEDNVTRGVPIIYYVWSEIVGKVSRIAVRSAAASVTTVADLGHDNEKSCRPRDGRYTR